MPRRGTRHAVGAAMLLLAGSAGCGHPSPVPHPAPARPSVTLSFCGSGPQAAPDVVEVIATPTT